MDSDVTTYQQTEQPAFQIRRETLWCFAVVCVGFTLTAEAWIQWSYRLLAIAGPSYNDPLTMVCGYLVQALGMALSAHIMRQQPRVLAPLPLVAVVTGHFVCSVPAALGSALPGVLVFGLLMCLLCGAIAGFYLHMLAHCVPTEHRATVFGSAYASSTILTWLLTLVPSSLPGQIPTALISELILSALCMLLVVRAPQTAYDLPDTTASDAEPSEPTTPNDAPASDSHVVEPDVIVALAACTVLFMSTVKNVGFSFPSTDLLAGVSMESSRLFYAIGLVIAGIVNDRDRKSGAMLCLAALVMPFALLAVSAEPVPATALWAVDYVFYGFFSVYRVTLFTDLAAHNDRIGLAAYGLLFGRVGDALGTAICLTLVGRTLVQVSVAAALFAVTVPVAFRLFAHLYAPLPAPVITLAPTRSEQEIFDDFSGHYGLSRREREVLRQVLAEHTNAEAAAELFVTESTVKYHVHNLLKKTACANRLELMTLYASERDEAQGTSRTQA